MKRKLFLLFFLLACTYAFVANIQTAKAAPADANANPALKLVFQDDFSGTAVNAGKWMNQLQWGHTNGSELQYYAPDAFSLSNGILHIKAQKRAMGGKAYTSGALVTYKSFKFTYGIVKIRARVPAGKGLWPALWLFDYAGGTPEIDIMELLGDKPKVDYMFLHYASATGNQNPGTYFTGPDFSAGFHIFSVDWSPTGVIWYVDGIQRYKQTSHIPTKPMYLIMNLAVGGDWPGAPNQNTKFPAVFDIDYVQIYQR